MAKTASRKKRNTNTRGKKSAVAASMTEMLALRAAASTDNHQAHTGRTLLEFTGDRSARKLWLHPSVGAQMFTTKRDLSTEERRDLAWPWPETIIIEMGKPLVLDKLHEDDEPEHIHALFIPEGPEPRSVLTLQVRDTHLQLGEAITDLPAGRTTLNYPIPEGPATRSNEERAATRVHTHLARYLSDPATTLVGQDGGWQRVHLSIEGSARLAAEPTDTHPGGPRLPLPNWRPTRSQLIDPARAISSCRTMRWVLRHISPYDDQETSVPAIASEDHIQADQRAAVADLVLDQDTKRVVISHIQLQNLLDASYEVPSEIITRLRWPFDDAMFIEPDRPLQLTPEENPDLLLQALMLWPGTESRHLGYVFTQKDSIYIHTYLVDAARAEAQLLSLTGSEPAPSTGMATARLLSYMTAKGIEIVEKHQPRAQRRLLAKKKLPNPWHQIRVSPTIRRNADGEDIVPGPGGEHGYRYDVAGHLRYGRHRLADGSYRLTTEWVRAHQRGLKHELYIPAVRNYKGTGDVDAALRELQTPPSNQRSKT